MVGYVTHDVVGLTQEGIHNTKIRKILAMVLNLDLSKAYDRVSWSYLRLNLIHIGMGLHTLNWIVGYLSQIYFAMLINAFAHDFLLHIGFLGRDVPCLHSYLS
jgi:hypothetical protein